MLVSTVLFPTAQTILLSQAARPAFQWGKRATATGVRGPAVALRPVQPSVGLPSESPWSLGVLATNVSERK